MVITVGATYYKKRYNAMKLLSASLQEASPEYSKITIKKNDMITLESANPTDMYGNKFEEGQHVLLPEYDLVKAGFVYNILDQMDTNDPCIEVLPYNGDTPATVDFASAKRGRILDKQNVKKILRDNGFKFIGEYANYRGVYCKVGWVFQSRRIDNGCHRIYLQGVKNRTHHVVLAHPNEPGFRELTKEQRKKDEYPILHFNNMEVDNFQFSSKLTYMPTLTETFRLGVDTIRMDYKRLLKAMSRCVDNFSETNDMQIWKRNENGLLSVTSAPQAPPQEDIIDFSDSEGPPSPVASTSSTFILPQPDTPSDSTNQEPMNLEEGDRAQEYGEGIAAEDKTTKPDDYVAYVLVKLKAGGKIQLTDHLKNKLATEFGVHKELKNDPDEANEPYFTIRFGHKGKRLMAWVNFLDDRAKYEKLLGDREFKIHVKDKDVYTMVANKQNTDLSFYRKKNHQPKATKRRSIHQIANEQKRLKVPPLKIRLLPTPEVCPVNQFQDQMMMREQAREVIQIHSRQSSWIRNMFNLQLAFAESMAQSTKMCMESLFKGDECGL